MTNFPSSLDDDSTLPSVFDNITEVGAEAINAQKDAILSIESTLGVDVQGSALDLAERLDYLLEPDGSPKLSVLNTIGLVTLPILNSHVSASAGILESKLALDYSTSSLKSSLDVFDSNLGQLQTWVSTNGNSIISHINGLGFRHELSDITVSSDTNNYLKNVFSNNRDNTSSYNVLNDLNSDFNNHRKKDGSGIVVSNITTDNGDTYTSNFAHPASGIFVDISQFNAFGNIDNLQELLQFLDNSSLLTFGGRIKNFYSNGITRLSYSTKLSSFTEGEELIKSTPAIAYLRDNGLSSIPFDDIDTGDDIINIKPSNDEKTSFRFDAAFSKVKVGDQIHVTYTSNVVKTFTIKEKKYDSISQNYGVRIYGKNNEYDSACSIRITKNLNSFDKYGSLAVGEAFTNYSADVRGLAVINPKSAIALGIGFDASQFDSNTYKLYLTVYKDGYSGTAEQIFPIDVTGNLGSTPGNYTLEGIVTSCNKEFRKIGNNLRFTAFSYEGEFGLALDPIGGDSFSVIGGIRSAFGSGYDSGASGVLYPKNVVNPSTTKDPLGFGRTAGGVASPFFDNTYLSVSTANFPTAFFSPKRKNNYYVNANELDSLSSDIEQVLDVNGDGYWLGKINSQSFIGGRNSTTYRIEKNLSTSQLAVGKSIIVKKKEAGTSYAFGRFIISSISYYDCGCDELIYTDISVVDATYNNNQSSGSASFAGVVLDDEVLIYSNNDSVCFNLENASDVSATPDCFRWFEIFVDSFGKTFSNERARMFNTGIGLPPYFDTSGPSNQFIITNISKKLKGDSQDSTIFYKKLSINFDAANGSVSCYFSNDLPSRVSEIYLGKVNQKIKVFDISADDFIEFLIPQGTPSFSGTYCVQLFPSIQNNQDVMALAGVWVPIFSFDQDLKVTKDLRQFGNVAVKDLSTESINFISAIDAVTQSNGIINGFDIKGKSTTEFLIKNAALSNEQTAYGALITESPYIDLNGGQAIVNGKIVLKNSERVFIPRIQDAVDGITMLYLVIDDVGDYKFLLKNSTGGAVKQVYDVFNPGNYDIDNYSLTEIRANKKYAILYMVMFVINTDSFPLKYIPVDIRKYSRSTDSLQGPTVDSIGENYTFNSFQSMMNYICLDPTYASTIYVKSATEYFLGSNYDNDDLGIFQPNQIVDIEFQSTEVIMCGSDGNSSLPSNFKFKNCTISIYNDSLKSTILRINNNLDFENVKFQLSSVSNTSLMPTYPILIESTGNISFNKCNFEFLNLGTSSYISSRFKAVSVLVNADVSVNDLRFTNCIFTNPSTNLFSSESSCCVLVQSSTSNTKISFSKCSFNGSYGKAIGLPLSISDVSIDECEFKTQIDYSAHSLYIADTDDILKAFEGEIFIYDDKFGTIGKNVQKNIFIKNNKFISQGQDKAVPKVLVEVNRLVDSTNYGFSPTSGGVGLALTIDNFVMTNNFFYEDSFTTNPMIVVINKSSSGESSIYYDPPVGDIYFPFVLNNWTIENNRSFILGDNLIDLNATQYFESKSKSIVITQDAPEKAFILKDVNIKNNTCSRIAYFGFKYLKSYVLGLNIASTKQASNGINIIENNCDYIHNCDELGQDDPVYSDYKNGVALVSEYFTGSLSDLYDFIVSSNINSNELTWLSVSSSSEYVYDKINDNKFTPQLESKLSIYGGTVKTSIWSNSNNLPLRISTYVTGTSGFYESFVEINGNNITESTTAQYMGYMVCIQGANITKNKFQSSISTSSGIAFYFRGGEFTSNLVKLPAGLTLHLSGVLVFQNDTLAIPPVVYSNNSFVGGDTNTFKVAGLFGDLGNVITSNNIGQRNFEIISLHEIKPIKRHTLPAAADYNVMNMYFDSSPGGSSRSIYSYLSFDDAGAIVSGVYEGIINLSNRIPDGSRITKITLGGVLKNSTNTASVINATSVIDMQLYYPNKTPTDLSSFYDVAANLTTTVDTTLTSDNYISASMSITDLNTRRNTTTSTYATLTGSNLYVSNHVKTKVAYLKVRMVINCQGGVIAEAAFSPLVIEYVQGYST